jgi:multidrug efflux system membrane fusion protein
MQPGGLCGTIVQLDPIKLVGFVPEADLDKIEVGALAGARLASGTEVQGRVTFLSRSGDDTTRTFRVEVTVPNPDLAIRDGQTADILVSAEGRVAHLLPQSALTLDDGGLLGIRAVTVDDRALFYPVTLLRDTVDGVWLTDLPEKIDVIVTGQEYVIDGVPVAPTFKEANG